MINTMEYEKNIKNLELKLHETELISESYKWQYEKYTKKFNNMKDIINNQNMDL